MSELPAYKHEPAVPNSLVIDLAEYGLRAFSYKVIDHWPEAIVAPIFEKTMESNKITLDDLSQLIKYNLNLYEVLMKFEVSLIDFVDDVNAGEVRADIFWMTLGLMYGA